MKRFALSTVLVGLMALPTMAEGLRMTPEQIALIEDFRSYDEACRGGRGNEPSTHQACGIRDYVAYLITESGLCYEKQGVTPENQDWHVCEAGSIRFEKPLSDR